MDLQSLGWNSRFSTELDNLNDPSLAPARVILGERELCTVACAQGELHGELAGSFRREASETGAYPVVGDWVAVVPRLKDGRATIHAILPRANAFVRRAATGWTSRHGQVREQVVAANLDIALIVCALDRDWNLRRLERYLTLAWGSGIQPMVVLNKVDLCREREVRIAETEAVAAGASVLAVSAETGEGIDGLRARLLPAATAALLGSSGVGKSTLINTLNGGHGALADGRGALATGAVRLEDGRGRHTTTRRELIVLPTGALLIDNPGMREVGLLGAEEDLDASFTDVAELARACRFSDCRHDAEPGCAVRAALEDGSLDEGRYAGWRRLQKELAHLATREDPRAQEAHRKLWKNRAKLQKEFRKDLRA